MMLCVLWVLLTVVGVAFQLYRERDRPPFPASPWSQFRFRQSAVTADSEYQPAGRSGSRLRNDEDETDPLLGGARGPGRTSRRRETPRSSSAGAATAPHWEPGERMWHPDAATSQSMVAPPPYSSQSTWVVLFSVKTNDEAMTSNRDEQDSFIYTSNLVISFAVLSSWEWRCINLLFRESAAVLRESC